jgi:hypothetical protein
MRSPLTDPRPGDIVRAKLNGAWWVRRVVKTSFDGALVTFERPEATKKVGPVKCHVNEWRSWCTRYKGEAVETADY